MQPKPDRLRQLGKHAQACSVTLQEDMEGAQATHQLCNADSRSPQIQALSHCPRIEARSHQNHARAQARTTVAQGPSAKVPNWQGAKKKTLTGCHVFCGGSDLFFRTPAPVQQHPQAAAAHRVPSSQIKQPLHKNTCLLIFVRSLIGSKRVGASH